MECQKVKCKANCRIKIGQSQLNMQAILQVFSKPPKILLARGYRLYKRKKNVNVFMKKVECRKVKWSNHSKNWANLTKLCKLYLQLIVFSIPPEILPARGTRPNKRKKIIPKSVRLQLGVQKSKIWSKP